MVATARGPKTAGLSLFAFVIHLHREVPAYEAGDDRFYGLVACELAAAHLGHELRGERIQFVASERQCGLGHGGGFACCTGCRGVHT